MSKKEKEKPKPPKPSEKLREILYERDKCENKKKD